MAKELSQTSNEGCETPVIKSLFDVQGNSKFKNKKAKASSKSSEDSEDDSDSSSNNSDSSSDDDEEEEQKKPAPTKIVFKSANPFEKGSEAPKTFAFANPFAPKESSVSPVFA